ncbi:MAG: hypothetical protein CR986_08665 [Ignavibacteriae bacterium]|nr:MAG: hypothetical protein CR986_08665 [Ignavibacteriota bacterium]
MFLRILFFVLGIYLFYKLLTKIINMFTRTNFSQSAERVYNNSTKTKSHIDKKDIIDAQFEEIEVKEKS